jgi:hypothetical protein
MVEWFGIMSREFYGIVLGSEFGITKKNRVWSLGQGNGNMGMEDNSRPYVNCWKAVNEN